MEGKDYIFCLQSKGNAFWQADNTGLVTLSNQPYFLEYSPIGWEGLSVQNIRHKRYWGIDRSVSAPLTYVNDGARILKDIFYKLGIEESVYLVILKQRLDIDPAPVGTVSINNLSSGDNAGTIIGAANSIVYIKVLVTGAAGVDNISGALGGGVFVGQFAGEGSKIYAVPVGNGVATIAMFFDNSSGTGTATFTVCNKDGSTQASYGYWYKQIYRGEVDLSQFQHVGAKVTCPTLEDGLPKYLKSNENTIYELPMNVPEAVIVKMDGIRLHQKANYSFIDGFNFNTPSYAVQFTSTDSEGDQYNVTNISEFYEEIPNIGIPEVHYVQTSDNYFFRNDGDTPIDVTLVGTVMVQAIQNGTSPLGNSELKVKSSDPTTGGQTWESRIFFLSPVEGVTHTYNINLPITVNPGVKLFMIGSSNSVNSSLYNFQYLPGSIISAKYITRRPSTYIRTLPPQYIFNRLVDLFTEGKFTAAASSYFDKHKNIVWTCGNAIRGLSTAVLKLCFSDFFQFYDCYDAVGISEKTGVVTFDSKINLIDRTAIITLPEPVNLKISVAKDFLFNELSIGYPEIKNDIGVLNGNEEFNTKFLFSLGTTKSPAKLDKVSKTKASCYEIEKIRTTIIEKVTTDNKADNDCFVLHIENTVNTDSTPSYYNLDRSINPTNPTLSGLIEPSSVFNIALSPKRMLLNNLPFLSSSMYLAQSILGYKSADKNNKLSCNGIVEKADVQLSLPSRFFIPLLLDFDVPAPEDLIGLLDLNPLSVFQFPFEGSTYTGILTKVSTGSSAERSQAYQLLSIESNPITELISFYG